MESVLTLRILQYFTIMTVSYQGYCGIMSMNITDIAVRVNEDIKVRQPTILNG